MEIRSNQSGLQSHTSFMKVLSVMVLMSVLWGCIGKDSKAGAEIQGQSLTEDNLTLDQNASIQNSDGSNLTKTNMIRLILRPRELNRTGKLPITLMIMNPKLNETVLTIFKPEIGQEWYNQTTVTYTVNNNWTQNFTIRPTSNISYIKMFVQISENNTVLRKSGWNISLPALFGKAK